MLTSSETDRDAQFDDFVSFRMEARPKARHFAAASCFSLLVLILSTLSASLSANNSKGTPAPTASNCHNVIYNSCSAGPNKEVKNLLQEMKMQLADLQAKIGGITRNKTTDKVHKKNCAELYKSGSKISGVYTIDPDGSGPFDVFCDQTTARGGWTVFQKRLDGSVNFYNGWNDYKLGFGNLNGEFWLGLDKINRLTNSGRYRLRVDLEDTTGKTAYAEYNRFAVSSERTKYKLSLGTYSGTAGDSLFWHRGHPFSTKDQDNDNWSSNCAVTYKGAWWYIKCHHSNLNGMYHHGQHSSYADGVNWYHWKGYKYSAKRAEMKIRPDSF